jgi:hypothetical protein
MAKHPHRREPMTTAERKGDVGRDMARLKGRSRNDVMSDAARGAGSPLGPRTTMEDQLKRRGR